MPSSDKPRQGLRDTIKTSPRHASLLAPSSLFKGLSPFTFFQLFKVIFLVLGSFDELVKRKKTVLQSIGD